MEQEEQIIREAQKNPSAFGALYDFYYKPIFGFHYSRTSHVETAKDLTNETFFQALKNIHRYKPKKGASFKSWLFSIAVAQVGNYYRKRFKLFEVTTEEAPELIERDEYRPDIAYQMGQDAQELQTQISLLKDVMKKLDQTQQTIISLRFFSRMSVPEIAEILSMKEGTVKSHIHRTLKRLQTFMSEAVESKKEVSTVEVLVPKTYESR